MFGTFGGAVIGRMDAVCTRELSGAGGAVTVPSGPWATVSAHVNQYVGGGSGQQSAPDLLNARLCCEGQDGCSLSDSMTRASQAQQAALSSTVPEGADSTRLANELTAKTETFTLEIRQSVAAACSLRIAVCEAKADAIIKELAGAGSNGCATIDRGSPSAPCAALKNKVAQVQSQCRSLSPNGILSKMQASQDKIAAAKQGVATVAAAAEPASGQATATGSAAKGDVTDPNAAGTGSGGDNGGLFGGSGLSSQLVNGFVSTMLSSLQSQDSSPSYQEDPPMDCASNPMIAGCLEAEQESWNSQGSNGGIQPARVEGGGFNPPDLDLSQDLPLDTSAPTAAKPNGTVNPIANGGGQFLGGGGAAPAALGPAANANPAVRSGGNTDILRGERGGGGYSQTNAAMNMATTSSGGFTGYGRPTDPSKLDLSQFLPGASKDPGRAIAGLANKVTYDGQVNRPQTNIWNRISDQFRARCSQGLLKDCVP